MKLLILVLSLLLLLVSCSSSADDSSAPACTILGSYSVTGVVESASPSCPAVSNGPPTVYTFTKGVDLGTVMLKATGFSGECALDTASCRIDDSCGVRFEDGSTATVQYAISFTHSGFSGIGTAGDGDCRLTSKLTGTRR